MKNYFTLSLLIVAANILNAQSPGGVSTNLVLWNKANLGVTVSGTTVTGWTDQTATNTFSITGSPQLDNAAVNYNPTITLNGSSRFTGNTSITSITHVFAIGFISNGTGITNSGAMIGTSGNNSSKYFFHTEGFPRHFVCNDGTAQTDATLGSNSVGYSVLTEDLGKTPTASDLIRQSGLNLNNKGGDPAPFSGTPVLGARGSENLKSGSAITEAIIYTSSLSASDQNKVESYLAVKYGFTLSNSGGGTSGDYVSSGGTTVWDASNGSGYHNKVFGIARDDNSGLLQKQSHQGDDSTRIYLSTLAADNISNAGSFSANGQFVMMGTDNARMYNNAGNAELPSSNVFISRFDREWKITNTAFTGTFSIDITPEAGTYDVSKLRLLVDDDGDFTNASVYFPTISYSGGIITISSISTAQIPANATRYFTLASIAAPGGVSANLSLWNEANTGLTVSGSNITGWIDQTTTNTFSVTGTPVLQLAPLNYNPTVLFNGSSRFTGNTSIANNTHAFAVGKFVNGSGSSTSGALIGDATIVSNKYFFILKAENFIAVVISIVYIQATRVPTAFPTACFPKIWAIPRRPAI